MMLSDRPFYGAGCLAPPTGDLVCRLSPQAKADHCPWVPLSPGGKAQWQGNGCCWRRAPLKSVEDCAQTVPLPACPLSERLEGDGNLDAKGPSGVVLGPTVEPEERHCRGFGHMMETDIELFTKSGPKVEGVDGHCPPTGCTPDACVGSYHAAGPTAEAGCGLYHGAGPTAEAGGGLYHGAGPTAEAGVGLYHGAGPTEEAGGGLYHGAGPTAEAGVGLYHGADPTAEEGIRLYHGAGPTAEAGDGLYHGPDPTAEAEGWPCDGIDHRVEKECRPYHGAGHKQAVISQALTRSASKDCAIKELTEPHKHQWRYQNVQDVEGNVITVTGPSEIQPHPSCEGTAGLTDPVTMETGTVGDQAQLCDATQAKEKVGDGDCEDEFGMFEKAGNLVQWAEFPGPLGLECETPHEHSYTAAGWSQESGEDMVTCRMWRPTSENTATETDMEKSVHPGASLHGSSNRAAENWRSTCPPSCVTPGHTQTSESGWRAFHSEDWQTQGSSFDAFPLNKWEIEQQGTKAKWWSAALERHPFQPTPSAQSSLDNVGLESVFHTCFPMVSSTNSGDPIPPLGQLLGTKKGGEGFLSTQACDLWASLQNVAETVGLKRKWADCQSRKLLLVSLCVDPTTTETSAGHTRTVGSSPLFSIDTRTEWQPSPDTLDWDYKELMLIKNSAPQIQNGYSPTHRIQAFFYHWTQADRNGKSKTTYDFNKNFMA
ncbi:uncharacterized protein LOC109926914 [Rhincodon typus]|uniref:uncharacterized protein LOC109926914 n=1 Tax=Rhincodon typus TaxID=259920 RepID=UPI002030962B|nr:uncharacterized protein LOC109926914 [Rhincodon typus]XP_048474222.1 uncharacterized protein LOC109926914 [Rhincodon typus]XP_048474223.1 uncharacterized protein LOC109926914 [Rhincodon typus]XP_048474224.1 uncharacterized protein LOC109926914 [Rhincodon typus]